ncbi:ROK family protein [Arthrobacter sp. ov118]|uniref:ROK family transcriptional regulator n=1 Tax=Arthrobacter sp. ov118 TaxID=1761747 RepID=UPI0008F00DC5|nr:ROK family protein [Arthrobacter sp. ov118]SFU11357.1 Sugar kinase of the NBD/HSP70 family, may contain an N-terminal HTH domain [Arthrobacter sp. ov118]
MKQWSPVQQTADTPALTDTERAVLAVVYAQRETTRPEISSELGLTKPTVSLAVAELEKVGLIVPLRARQGSIGRSATVYGLAESAGWLLGIDLGSTRLQLLARGLDGRSLASSSLSLDSDDDDGPVQILKAVRDQVARVAAPLSQTNGPLRAVGIALPRIIPQYLEQSAAGSTEKGHALPGILEALSLPEGVPVLLENNVNCAALAEMERGTAQDHDDFVFLQVGVGIGAGIVADRRVLRGAHGGAGEISSLPVGWPARDQGDEFALEHYLGSRELLRRCTSAWDPSFGPAPTTVPELFEHARTGTPPAVTALAQHANDIGQLALTLTAVVDPALIVLGGGVGQNPLLTAGVTGTVHRFKPEISVRVSDLGDQATVEGAVALTLDHALSGLLGSRHTRRLDGRTTVLTTRGSA